MAAEAAEAVGEAEARAVGASETVGAVADIMAWEIRVDGTVGAPEAATEEALAVD